jgi:hypothetical protein
VEKMKTLLSGVNNPELIWNHNIDWNMVEESEQALGGFPSVHDFISR